MQSTDYIFLPGLKNPKKNEYYVDTDTDTICVKLTRNKIMYIDIKDIDILKKYVFRASSRDQPCYAQTTIYEKIYFYHRIVLSIYGNEVIDHIDRNGLNNKRSNLRIVTQSINCRNRTLNKDNTSGFKGICFDIARNCWRAQIADNNNKRIHRDYSTGKYGNDRAKELALLWRKQKEEEFGYL